MISPQFALKVLGDPVLLGPDGPLSGRAAYKRRMAVLAVLAVARGRPVGRERVIGLLWPEHATARARHTLSESLYVLRCELGEDLFTSVSDEIALNPAVLRTDVGAFHDALEQGRLEDAVAEYGGPLLDGLFVNDAPEFERWVDTERDRLARACGDALERLATQAEAEGSRLEAVTWWRRLAVHDPYSSRVALRLAQALDAAGERAGALRAAAAHATRLRDELGVEPDVSLAVFVEGLRAETRPAPDASPPAAPPPAAPAASPAPVESAAVHLPAGDPAPAPLPVQTETETELDTGIGIGMQAPPAAAPGSGAQAVDGAGAGVADGGRTVDGGAAPAERGVDAVPSADAADDSLPAPAPARGPGTERTGRNGSARRGRWRVPAAVAATLAVVVALAAAVLRPFAGAPEQADAPRYDPRRIAVLYFEDDSPGGELGYLASGLTGELIDALGQVPALEVVSRNAVKAYRDGVVSLDSLVAELQVGSVVEGSVQRSGDSVRVRVELVDPHRRSPLESRTLVLPLDDLFALETAVGEEVGAFLRRRLGQEVRLRQAQAETRSSAALALVLRAEQVRDQSLRLARTGHPLDAASAVRLLGVADSMLARAEKEDPRWARPTVLRAHVAVELTMRSPNARQAPLLRQAAGHADRVLAREPRNAPALGVRGAARWRLAMESDTAGQAPLLVAAERDLRAALDADSTLASGWATLSLLLRMRGRFAESDLAARRALDQDAYLDDAAGILQRLYFGAMTEGDYAAARPLCARGSAQFPGDWRFVECRLTLLREDPSLPPDPARAWALVAELSRLDPDGRARDAGRPYSPLYRQAAVAAVLARAGAADSARAVLARLHRQAGNRPELRLPLLYDEAYVLLLLGDRAGARRRLDEYLAERPSLRAYVARDVFFRELFAPARAPAAAP